MTNTSWYPTKDKYGRANHELSIDGRVAAVVIVLPQKGSYQVGLRILPLEWVDGRIVDNPLHGVRHSSLKVAKAWTERTVTWLRAIPADLSKASRDQLLVARSDAQREVQTHEYRLATLDRLGVEADSVSRDEPLELAARAMNRVFAVNAALLNRTEVLV